MSDEHFFGKQPTPSGAVVCARCGLTIAYNPLTSQWLDSGDSPACGPNAAGDVLAHEPKWAQPDPPVS